jgi:hypothetical protein
MARSSTRRKAGEPRDWRWFLAEFAVVAAGVLAALAAEQIVQALDWQQRVADAEHDLRAELEANAVNAFSRLSTARCATIQIEARRQVLRENRDAGRAVPIQPVYVREFQAWFLDSWEGARQMQLAGHVRTERLQQFSLAYTLAATFRDQQRAEQELKPAIDTLAENAGHLTIQERDRLFLALRELEEQSNRLDNIAFRYLEALKPLGLSVPAAKRTELLKRSPAFYATNGVGVECVLDPSPWLDHGARAVQWLMTRKGEP